MNRSPITALLVAICVWTAGDASAQCVWGSFDASRINYSGGLLTGSGHVTLRSIIAQEGGTVGPSTATLTPAYLAGVNVFYTSLLSTSTGALSAAEQAALVGWVNNGGTLVVTGDIFPLAAYDSFTSPFGVTNYVSISTASTGFPLATHALTQGITSYSYVTNCSFSFGTDALLLGDDGSGNAFMVVLEPSTGYFGGGRVVVLGDHNMFTESYITGADNAKLAKNIANWACNSGSPTCPSHFATWSNYGNGWPGTQGVPTLVPTNNPVVGQPLGLQVGNSLGSPTTGYLLLGLSPANQASGLGGTILVNFVPALVFAVPLAQSGVLLAGNVPNDPTLCGVSLYVQFLEVDAGATQGASFTRGLKLDFG